MGHDDLRVRSEWRFAMGAMRWVCVACVVGMMGTVGGCQTVRSDHLVGKLADREATATFAGRWGDGEREVEVRVVGPGELEARGLLGNDKPEKVWVTTQGGMTFLQAEVAGDGAAAETAGSAKGSRQGASYLFFLAVWGVGDHRDLVLFEPNTKTFEAAVKRGELEGVVMERAPEVKGGKATPAWLQGVIVEIYGGKEAWDRFVAAEPVGEAFEIGAPMVLERDQW